MNEIIEDNGDENTIDSRILKVCELAEKEYLKNKMNEQKEKIMDKYEKDLATDRNHVQNKSYFTTSKIGRIANKSINLENNLLSQRFFNGNNNDNDFLRVNSQNVNSNNFNKTLSELKNANTQNIQYNQNNQKVVNNNIVCKINENVVINSKENINNDVKLNSNVNGENLINNNRTQIQKINNKNPIRSVSQIKNNSQNNKFQNNFSYNNQYNNNLKESSKIIFPQNINNIASLQSVNIQNLSQLKKIYKPLYPTNLKKNNAKNRVFSHDIHIKTKNNYDLEKLLLEAKNLIKLKKYVKAYNLLKEMINIGEYHSDLFYLFGEVNLKLKNYQVAEDYLLLALNFELHSPYVFYWMGILYQELKAYEYSNMFFKLFNRLIDNKEIHFLMAQNYVFMNKFVKAANEISKAIELDNNCAEFYRFRSEIYKNMGLKEMENEDLNMYKFILQKKIEENS